jgi:hypothetical protein
MIYTVQKIGRGRWIVVQDYRDRPRSGSRQGIWIAQRSGGYTVHNWDLARCIADCPDPYVYYRRQDAINDATDHIDIPARYR